MLAVAARVAPARFVLSEAEHLPFADATFDAVTATFTFRHRRGQTAGLAEIGRVLAAGGAFGLAAPLPLGARQWPVRRQGRARLPEALVTGLADAGLRLLDAETVAGYGPITEVTLVLAGRDRPARAAGGASPRRPRPPVRCSSRRLTRPVVGAGWATAVREGVLVPTVLLVALGFAGLVVLPVCADQMVLGAGRLATMLRISPVVVGVVVIGLVPASRSSSSPAWPPRPAAAVWRWVT